MAPTQIQRVEQLEQDFVGLHASMNEVMLNQQTMGEKLSSNDAAEGGTTEVYGRDEGVIV